MKPLFERRAQLPDYPVRRIDLADAHIYNLLIDGLPSEYYRPGATSILGVTKMDPNLFAAMMNKFPTYTWYKTYMQIAGERGTNIHCIIERLLDGEEFLPSEYRDKELEQAKMIMDWIDEFMEEIWGSELMLAHQDLDYAGSIDLVGKDIYGNGIIVDFKSGAEDKEKHAMQVSMYAKLYNSVFSKHNRPVTKGIILYTSVKKSGIKVVTVDDLSAYDDKINANCAVARAHWPQWFVCPEKDNGGPLYGWETWSIRNWS